MKTSEEWLAEELKEINLGDVTEHEEGLLRVAYEAGVNANKKPVATVLLQRWVICRLFKKHKYYTIKKYSKTVRKVGCRRCEKVWGMNDRVKSLSSTQVDWLCQSIR